MSLCSGGHAQQVRYTYAVHGKTVRISYCYAPTAYLVHCNRSNIAVRHDGRAHPNLHADDPTLRSPRNPPRPLAAVRRRHPPRPRLLPPRIALGGWDSFKFCEKASSEYGNVNDTQLSSLHTQTRMSGARN